MKVVKQGTIKKVQKVKDLMNQGWGQTKACKEVGINPGTFIANRGAFTTKIYNVEKPMAKKRFATKESHLTLIMGSPSQISQFLKEHT